MDKAHSYAGHRQNGRQIAMTTPIICKKCNLPTEQTEGYESWCACVVGVDITEDGEPLGDCRDHGIYSGGSCGGCDAIEEAIDRAIEKEHESKRGNNQW